MDIKKILWIIFGFVIFGLIAVAVIAIVRTQITNMQNQTPTFPQVTNVTDAAPVQAEPSFTYSL